MNLYLSEMFTATNSLPRSSVNIVVIATDTLSLNEQHAATWRWLGQ
jgi:hypothetical protein